MIKVNILNVSIFFTNYNKLEIPLIQKFNVSDANLNIFQSWKVKQWSRLNMLEFNRSWYKFGIKSPKMFIQIISQHKNRNKIITNFHINTPDKIKKIKKAVSKT